MFQQRKSVRSAPKGRPSIKHRVSATSKSGSNIGFDGGGQSQMPRARRTISGAPRGQGMTEAPRARHSTIERGARQSKPGGFIQRLGSLGEELKPSRRKKKKSFKLFCYKPKCYFRVLTGVGRWIWPEWSESDINAEKWDKSSSKGKSTPGSYFEDPDGLPTLPKSIALKCTQWKRIPDLYATGGGTSIVESESATISLLQSNTHLLSSPYIRYIIGQLKSLQ